MSLPKREFAEIKELTQESRNFWDKMNTFKQKFKENEARAKSLQGNLTKVNFELSLVRSENSRLNEKLEEQRTSITKYQQILKDLVEVEDRYCKALVDKKITDEELASEKKLRLELQSKWASEKSELQKSLQSELQILRESAANKEKCLQAEYSKIIEEQRLEKVSLKQQVTEANKKQDEIDKLDQELANKRKEIARLKSRPLGQDKLMIVNNVMLKPVTSIQTSEDVGRNDVTSSEGLEYEESHLEQNQKHLDNKTNSDVTCSERTSSNPRNPALLPTGTYIATPNQHGPESSGSRKCNSLEVFRIPARIRRKSPLKRKRKLYSRDDDTI